MGGAADASRARCWRPSPPSCSCCTRCRPKASPISAGRSESLSGMFALRRLRGFPVPPLAAISWARRRAVVVLFGAAVLTKEQAVVLPALFLLTDYWWNPASRFAACAPTGSCTSSLAVGAAAASRFLEPDHRLAPAAAPASRMKDFTWYQYLFTQFRVIFVYICNFRAARPPQRGLGLPDLAHTVRPRRRSSACSACWRWRRSRGATAAVSRWPATASSCSCCCWRPPRPSCRLRTRSPSAACTSRCSA